MNVLHDLRGQKTVQRHEAPGLGEARGPRALDHRDIRHIARGQGYRQLLDGDVPFANKLGAELKVRMGLFKRGPHFGPAQSRRDDRVRRIP